MISEKNMDHENIVTEVQDLIVKRGGYPPAYEPWNQWMVRNLRAQFFLILKDG